MFLKTAKCDFLISCFTFHQFKYFKISMKGPLCNLELYLNPLDFAKSESRMEDTGTFSKELNQFSLIDKNHFLITLEFYDKSRNVSWQDFLTIYFKMVKLGDGLLCVSKAYVGAWLLGLVSSSCLMVIPTKYYNTVQYLSVQPILLVNIQHGLGSGRDGSLSILLKVVRLSEAKFIQIFKAVRNVLRSGFVFRLIKSLSFKYPKMTDLSAQRVNFTIFFAQIRVICKSNIIVKEGEVDLKSHIFIFMCFNTHACLIALLHDMLAEQFNYLLQV